MTGIDGSGASGDPIEGEAGAGQAEAAAAGKDAGKAVSGGVQLDFRMLALLLVLALAAAAMLFFVQPQEDDAISVSEFTALLSASNRTAVIEDIRAVPAPKDDLYYNRTSAVFKCGIDLSYKLAISGKNVSVYAFEGDSCVCAGCAASGSRPVDECLKEMRMDGRIPFYVEFSGSGNRTGFSTGGAKYSGDAAFLRDCAVTGLVK